MTNRVQIPPKRLGETVILGANGNSPFNFISSLGPTETIATAVVTCTVYSGTDLAPAAVINGVAATIVGQQVQQKVTAGVLGVIYELACSVLTSLGQTLELVGYMAVIPDLP